MTDAALIAALITRCARAEGRSEAQVRISLGLPPDEPQALPRMSTAAGARWFDEHNATD